MAKGKQWESPQVETRQYATKKMGGDTPSMNDVIGSANARAQRRHDVKGSNNEYADEGFLPNSSRMAGNEMVGIHNGGYLVKKNLPYGIDVFYNTLPPGMDIEDQEVTDQRKLPMRTYSGGLSFPTDGWT